MQTSTHTFCSAFPKTPFEQIIHTKLIAKNHCRQEIARFYLKHEAVMKTLEPHHNDNTFDFEPDINEDTIRVFCKVCHNTELSGNRTYNLNEHLERQKHVNNLKNTFGVTFHDFKYDVAKWFMGSEYEIFN